MATGGPTISHRDAIRLLERVGLLPEAAASIVAQLPDPIDIDAAQPVFARYGLSMTTLTDRMGGSP